ncbi:MAG: hypothetical protein ABR587_15185 [Candidatus Binatia bacterium]
MTWTRRMRRAVATALVVSLIAIGAISATHSHAEEGATGGDHCATCRIVHSASVAPAAATPVPIVVVVESVESLHCRIPTAVRVAAAAPRGPPSLSF